MSWDLRSAHCQKRSLGVIGLPPYSDVHIDRCHHSTAGAASTGANCRADHRTCAVVYWSTTTAKENTMSHQPNYRLTARACYVGNFTQAIVVNLTPILFIPLRERFG